MAVYLALLRQRARLDADRAASRDVDLHLPRRLQARNLGLERFDLRKRSLERRCQAVPVLRHRFEILQALLELLLKGRDVLLAERDALREGVVLRHLLVQELLQFIARRGGLRRCLLRLAQLRARLARRALGFLELEEFL